MSSGGDAGDDLVELANRTDGDLVDFENDVTAPSLHTLVQLSGIFNRSVDYFLDIHEKGSRGYAVQKASENGRTSKSGVSIVRLMEETAENITLYRVVLKPGAKIDGPPVLHKGLEFVTVCKGSLSVTVEGEVNVLEQNDSIRMTTSFVEKWENSTDEDIEFFYLLY